MRSISALAFLLLPMAMASAPALGSELDAEPQQQELEAEPPEIDLEPYQRRLSSELQERIERSVLPELTARMERESARVLARPGPRVRSARVSPRAVDRRTTVAGRVAPDADAGPGRMICRKGAGRALECTVVARPDDAQHATRTR